MREGIGSVTVRIALKFRRHDSDVAGTSDLTKVSKKCMKIRQRILLPCWMGALSLALVIWDVHNQRVIYSMGMGWDTGAPLWPYQTPEILLFCLNYPAHYVAGPVANHLDLASPKHYLLVFPATLLWWWFIGFALDNQLWRGVRRSCLRSVILIGAAAIVFWASIVALDDAFRWWFQYGQSLWSSQVLLLWLKLAPAVWGFFLSWMIVVAAKRSVFPQRL
jgi:hypothetical protein